MSKYPLCEKLGLKVNIEMNYGTEGGFEICTILADPVERLLEKSQVVYGRQYEGQDIFFWNNDKNGSSYPFGIASEQALLIMMEPIKREPCKHSNWQITDHSIGNCLDCGAKLVAEWKEVK